MCVLRMHCCDLKFSLFRISYRGGGGGPEIFPFQHPRNVRNLYIVSLFITLRACARGKVIGRVVVVVVVVSTKIAIS